MNSLILDPTENPAEDELVPFVPRKHTAHLKHHCFHKEIDPDGVCTLTFDTPDSEANVWNADTLDELDCHIEDLHRDRSVRALIIRSGKPRIFIAGADLKAVRRLDEESLRELMSLGQDVFVHLGTLRFPKVAAIHGACLGGGFELALACDWRVASDSECTRIGLPETQIGLIPAWGGSTRLPRLIGLHRALDLIVRGKILKARDARRAGLVHEVAAREDLDALALRHALRSLHPRRRRFFFSHLWPWPLLVRHKAKTALFEKFPWMKTEPAAPAVAVDVVTAGVMMSVEDSLALEQAATASLIQSPVSRGFLDAFLANEAASKKLPAGFQNLNSRPVKTAAVIGAGVMGSGIAGVLAGKGVRVLMQDAMPDALARGMGRISESLRSGVKKHALTKKQERETLDRLIPMTNSVPLTRVDLIIEAAVEEMSVKKEIFADLAARSSPQTILATNTSALSVGDLAAATPHPERVIGLHFFNPPHLMPLVEIITHEGVSAEVVASALRFVQSLGKTPVLVKDSPGFVVNRILMPYLMGAVALAETMADPWKIDAAMTQFGLPMGPLRLLDEVGFDVALHVAGTLVRAFPDRMKSSPLLEAMVKDGMLGRKNGTGFYLYSGRPTRPNPAARRYLHANLDTAVDAEALISLMRDEARLCVAEGIVAGAADINLAMMLGTGFPPFRKLL